MTLLNCQIESLLNYIDQTQCLCLLWSDYWTKWMSKCFINMNVIISASTEEPQLRHVEKDVLIPKMMREKAKERCAQHVDGMNHALYVRITRLIRPTVTPVHIHPHLTSAHMGFLSFSLS